MADNEIQRQRNEHKDDSSGPASADNKDQPAQQQPAKQPQQPPAGQQQPAKQDQPKQTTTH